MTTVFAKESTDLRIVDLARATLEPRGIAIERVPELPADLGYHTGKYALQRPIPHAHAMARLRKVAPGVRAMPSTPLLDADLSADSPIVLKRPDYDRHGVNKFLVTSQVQRQRVERLRETRPDVAAQWVVQPYIEGPMPGVRSAFRLVVTASGALVASSLLYRVTSPSERIGAPEGQWARYFTHPDSPYYLDSPVIASNAPPGSRVIPLKINGTFDADVSNIQPFDREVAESHGVGDLQTPSQLAIWARAGGLVVGPHVDVVMGADFVPGPYLTEFNASPAQDTTRAWYNFSPSMSVHDVYRFELNAFANGLRAPG
jgi:hypothetical protein